MKTIIALVALSLISFYANAINPCNCKGYAGPGGPCCDGLSGPCCSDPGKTGMDCPSVFR
jgi:hypothetical protein